MLIYFGIQLSLQKLEDLLFEGGIDICHGVPAGNEPLSVFVGLFKVVEMDFASELMRLLSACSPLLGVPVRGGVEIARKLYDGATRVIQATGVQPLLGNHNGAIARCGYYVSRTAPRPT